MHKLQAETVTSLVEKDINGPAVTIYLPTHRNSSPPNMTEDQIRFKNLYRKAIDALQERDKHHPFNQQFLDQCEALLDSREFWEHMSESMVIIATTDMFEYYHLPIDSDEYVAVDDHFHLVPVLGLVNDMQDFHVLSVAQHGPTLFDGDLYELTPSSLELPATLEEALNIDEMHVKSLQFSAVNSSKGGMYHGHGAGKDTGDEERMKFWRLIDSMVCYHIDTKKPLILSGTDSEIAEYCSITKHPHILESRIDGSYGKEDALKLHEQAVEIMQSEFIGAKHMEALNDYERINGQSPERTASHMEDLQDSASKGKVATLLVGMMRHTTDTVRDNKHAVPKLVFPDGMFEKKIDDLAKQVVTQGGAIVSMLQEQMPRNQMALAINRY